MRKNYEYLQDSYYEDANSQMQRRNFLATIDSFVNQKVYVKITLLNWEEEPIKEIAGELTSGTISKDGSSSVRRTCQLSATVSRGEYDVEDTELDFSINKKAFIEIGVKNYSDEYKELKKELFLNQDYVEYQHLENEIQLLILEMNQRLKKLTNERKCHHENY